jgi:drug/metabolite transporter (DMT)-like permease
MVFGFLAILCMGGSVIIAKIGLGEIPALQATFLHMSAGLVGILAVALARRQFTASLEPLRRAGVQGRFLTAVTVVTFGGFWLSLLAIKRLDVPVANTLLGTEPLFALPLSLLWLRERPVALAWSGAAIALPARSCWHLMPDTGTGTAKGPSEDYGNEEHTTVAAFLPWRGS